MSIFCDEEGCDLTYAHRHFVRTNFYGEPIQVIEVIGPPGDGKVIRDSETGEIIFAARKDRLRVVKPTPPDRRES